MLFKFIKNKKEIKTEAEVCDNVFSQGRGLMFRKESKPLLFIFKNKKRRAIHSFFCKKFYAIWFDGDKIVDEKLVNPWISLIKPKEKFDKLLEIPTNTETFKYLRNLF